MKLNIIEALKDKKLLGQFIRDEKTWAAWFAFLKTFFALKPSKQDMKFFKKCTGRRKWSILAALEAWLIIGTRGGKSRITALMTAFLAIFKKYSLSSGENGYIIIVAPTKRQAGIIKRYLSSFFNDNAFFSPFLVRETSEEIELNNNIIIAVLSSDYRSLRGYTAVAAIVDEIAYLNLEGSKPDVEVIRALRTRLTSTGGPLICISSPYAKRGMLYEVHKKHYGKSKSRILVWQADSLTMNPTLNKDAIKQAYLEDPEGSKADYGAEFRSDIESYVSREAVEACVIPGRIELPPIAGVKYSAFVDPSGGSKDSMTLGISHTENDVKILDAIREAKPPFSPDQVVRDFADLLKRYRMSNVVGDRYAGEWPRERFRVYGIYYKPADKPKSDLYRDFMPLINSGQVELLDNDILINQIINLERRTGRGGKDSIDHTPGQHDDVANVCAGVLVGAKKGITPRISIINDTPPKPMQAEPLPAEDVPKPLLTAGERAIPIYVGDRIIEWEIMPAAIRAWLWPKMPAINLIRINRPFTSAPISVTDLPARADDIFESSVIFPESDKFFFPL